MHRHGPRRVRPIVTALVVAATAIVAIRPESTPVPTYAAGASSIAGPSGASQPADRIGAALDATNGGRPFAATSPWNTPTPAATRWFDTSVLHTLPVPVDGSSTVHWFVNTKSVEVVYATPSDPMWTFVMPNFVAPAWNRNRPAQVLQVHAPPDMQAGTDSDAILVVVDGDQYYEVWGAVVEPVTRTVTGLGWATGDIVNGPGAGSKGNNDGVRAANFSWAGGLITGHDLRTGKIDHALAVALNWYSLKATSDFVAPATAWDNGGATGPIKMGSKIGIPAGTPRPAGLSQLGNMVFDALQTYGAYVGDFAGGPWPMFYADSATVTDAQVCPLFCFWNYQGSADMEKLQPLLRVANYQP